MVRMRRTPIILETSLARPHRRGPLWGKLICMHEIERPSYIKDAPRRVFDTHVHYPWRARGSKLPIYTADGMLDMLAYNCQRLNIFKLCLLGRPGEGNDLVEKATERYPSLIGAVANIV